MMSRKGDGEVVRVVFCEDGGPDRAVPDIGLPPSLQWEANDGQHGGTCPRYGTFGSRHLADVMQEGCLGKFWSRPCSEVDIERMPLIRYRHGQEQCAQIGWKDREDQVPLGPRQGFRSQMTEEPSYEVQQRLRQRTACS